METLKEKLFEWLRELLVSGIMDNLSTTFNALNDKVGDVAGQLSTSPADFQPDVFNLIRNISESVIMPIAGVILTFIACCELIQLVVAHNNLANFETWIFFKWIFKTYVAVLLITHTFDITMAVFDVTGYVISQSGGLIGGNTAVDGSALTAMQSNLESMEVGALFGVFLQSLVVNLLFNVFAVIIFVIVYGRMIEIYLMVSLAPIPFATFGSHEQSMVGQNYLRSLFALGFQGFLILICVAIYAVLLQTVSITDDIMGSLWGILGYTVLLSFTLFKTGTIAKSVLHAH